MRLFATFLSFYLLQSFLKTLAMTFVVPKALKSKVLKAKSLHDTWMQNLPPLQYYILFEWFLGSKTKQFGNWNVFFCLLLIESGESKANLKSFNCNFFKCNYNLLNHEFVSRITQFSTNFTSRNPFWLYFHVSSFVDDQNINYCNSI